MPINLTKVEMSTQDMIVKDISMISTVPSCSKKMKPSRDSTVEVTKIYEGQKSFWRFDANVTFLIFEHKTEATNCIEVISYFSSDDLMEAPRLYLSSKKILENVKKIDIIQENKTIMHSGIKKAMYIFNRIVMIKKPKEEGVSFNVSLLPLMEDLQIAERSNICFNVDYGPLIPVLGLLPNIFRRDEIGEAPVTDLMLEWGRKLALYQSETVKFQEHTNEAGKYCKATGDAFASFLGCFKHKTYAEDAIGVSIPRRRWCKAIRMQLLRGHVQRITEMLDRRERERVKMLGGEYPLGIENGVIGILDGLSERLEELTDMPINTKVLSLTKPITDDKSEKLNLIGEVVLGDMTPNSPGLFLIPLIKVKIKSNTNLLNSGFSSPLVSNRSLSKSGFSSPTSGLSRQSSLNMDAVGTALEKTETDIKPQSMDESGSHARRRSRRYTSMEIKRAPSTSPLTTLRKQDSNSGIESGIGFAQRSPRSMTSMSLLLPQSSSSNIPIIREGIASRNNSVTVSDSPIPMRVMSRANSIVLSAATQAALAMMAATKGIPTTKSKAECADSDDETTSSPAVSTHSDQDSDLDGVGCFSRQSSLNKFPILHSMLQSIEEGPVQWEMSGKVEMSGKEGAIGIPPTSFLPIPGKEGVIDINPTSFLPISEKIVDIGIQPATFLPNISQKGHKSNNSLLSDNDSSRNSSKAIKVHKGSVISFSE
jgi:hypothetical protein